MCGITGIFDTQGNRDIPRDLLHRMNETQFHRGPDEGGLHLEPGVGLGHRRLSIIDLSTGQQPLYNEDGSVVVVFNGEDLLDGQELWVSDGTQEGTGQVMDICPGACDSTPDRLHTSGEVAYFQADDGVHGRELWKSDGTEAGTVMIEDIYPGDGGSSPYQLTDVNGTLYFGADDWTHGFEQLAEVARLLLEHAGGAGGAPGR